MEQKQSYQYDYAASFDVIGLNEPFKGENPLVALGGVAGWAQSLNQGVVVVEPTAEIPFNVLTAETIAEGFLLARQGVG